MKKTPGLHYARFGSENPLVFLFLSLSRWTCCVCFFTARYLSYLFVVLIHFILLCFKCCCFIVCCYSFCFNYGQNVFILCSWAHIHIFIMLARATRHTQCMFSFWCVIHEKYEEEIECVLNVCAQYIYLSVNWKDNNSSSCSNWRQRDSNIKHDMHF